MAADDFRAGPKEGIQRAASLGYDAVELDATVGDVDLANLSRTGARHLRRLVDGLGLELAVLGGRLGGAGLGDSARVERCIEKTAQILELAATLRVPVVTTHLGLVPGDPKDLQRESIVQAVRHLGERADATGTLLAVQTAENSPTVLRALLDEIDCPMVRVCYDPGWQLAHGRDPIAGIGELSDAIVSSYLRDVTAGTADAAGREVRMGSGQVDFLKVLAALEQGQTPASRIVRCTAAANPKDDLALAKEHLDSLLP